MKTNLKNFFSLIAVIAGGLYMLTFAAIEIITILAGLPREILLFLAIIATILFFIHSIPVRIETIYVNDSEKKNFEQANLNDLRIMLKEMKDKKDNTILQLSSPYSHFKEYERLKEKISLCKCEIKKRKWQKILGKSYV